MSAFGSKRKQTLVSSADGGIIGWEGQKPDDPVILWNSPILARCNPNNTRLCWFDNDAATIPRELVTSISNTYTGNGPVLGFDASPGGWGQFNNGVAAGAPINGVYLPGYTNFPSVNGECTLIVTFRMPVINGDDRVYSHIFDDASMWSNGCSFALVLRTNRENSEDSFIYVYTNRGEIQFAVYIPVGTTNTPVISPGSWTIAAVRLDNTVGHRMRLKTFPSVGVDLLGTGSSQVSWGTGPPISNGNVYVGCVDTTTSSGRHWRDQMGLAYFLPTSLSDSELDYIIDNPYHFLQEA